jgi:iron complex transport system substrate-binding protein
MEPEPRGANAHGGIGAAHAGGIVSLSPALTHTAQALGAGDRIVGRTAWCDAPEARIVGSLEDRDLEAIVALRPALVLRQSSAPDPALEVAARGVGARVVEVRAIDRVRDVEDAAANVADALESMGVAGARARAAEATAAFHRSTASPVACTRPVVFLYSTDPPAAFGAGTFVDDAWRSMGGCNAVTAQGYPTMSAEDLVRLAPAAIVIVVPKATSVPDWVRTVAPAVAMAESNALLEPSLRMLERAPAALRAVDAELVAQGAGGGAP